MKKVFEYRSSDVKDKPLLDIFVRSASKKQMAENKKLFAFFLHKGTLWMWTETSDNGKLEKLQDTTSLDSIEGTPTQFYVKNREICIDYLDNGCKKEKCSLVVNKVSVLYSTIRVDEMYREPHNDRLKMKGMAIDVQSNKLLLMQKDANVKNQLRFVIVDMIHNRNVGVSWIAD